MYITKVSNTYKPLVYGNIHDLREFLKLNTILNKSNRVLSDEEVETLALGLNFIPTRKTNRYNNIQRSDEITKFTNDFNKTIHWLLNPTIKSKGPLEHLINSPWIAPSRPWTKDPNVRRLIDAYRRQCVQKRDHYNPTHPKILSCILKLKNDPSINITPADKGGCTVIWSDDEYNREASRQLSDLDTYESISEAQAIRLLHQLVTLRHSTAQYLFNRNIITLRVLKAIIASPSEASPIYFLPKIHKEINPVSLTFPGRPIVATYNSTLYLIDNLLTELTAPLLDNIPGSCIDSTTFLNALPKGTLTPNANMLTSDVNSLYPSIPRDDGIHAATRYYADNIQILRDHFSSKGYTTELPTVQEFSYLLKLVINNSIIHFRNSKFFLQKKGTAMGVCISVYFANTFMFSITRNYIEKPLPNIIFWTRFIDDFFVLTTASLPEINKLFKAISTTDIGYSLSKLDKTATFLDVSLSINGPNTIETEPFFKPTSTPFYLHASSNHPPSTIQSIPFAQLIRLKRISSSDLIFQKHAKRMISNFKLRGFKLKQLRKNLDAVNKLSRESLLLPSSRFNRFANSLKIIRPFSPHFAWSRTRSIVSNLLNAAIRTFEGTPIHRSLTELETSLIFCTDKNIRSHFSQLIKNGRT